MALELIYFLVSLMLSTMLVFWLKSGRSFLNILDVPNERSLHSEATHRTGGAGINLTWLVVAGYYFATTGFDTTLIAILTVAVVLAAVFLLNDRLELSIATRLGVQAILCVLTIATLESNSHLLSGPVQGIFLTILAGMIVFLGMMWFVNLFNFMDGMDGLAGGMAIAGFTGLMTFGLLKDDTGFVTVNFILLGAVAGFLIFNLPRARIFMGDSGSIVLGYLGAALSLYAVARLQISVSAVLILYLPFIADASYTLTRRILRREKFWQAHKVHIYQRLAESPLGVKKTLLIHYIVMLSCLLSAVKGEMNGNSVVLLGMWIILYIILILASERYFKKRVAEKMD